MRENEPIIDIHPDTLFVIYTWKCNSKCISCDYWKKTRKYEIENKYIISAVEELYPIGLRSIYFTGGEALMRADDLFRLAFSIKSTHSDLSLYLVTNGLLLKNYASIASELFDRVIVSMDASNATMYRNIRGIDGFDSVLSGIKQVKEIQPNIPLRLRTLVLQENVNDLFNIVELAAELEVERISFIPINLSSTTAFGRDYDNCFLKHNKYQNFIIKDDLNRCLSLQIEKISKKYLSNKQKGLLVENLNDLKRVQELYKGYFCVSWCTAGIKSLVINHDGRIMPCFFIDSNITMSSENDLTSAFYSNIYQSVLRTIINGTCALCANCVCPIHD